MFCKFKRCTAFILIFLSLFVNSYASEFASYIEEARILYDLGFYKGVAQSYFESDLDSFTDKETAVVFLLRLIGQKNNVEYLSEYDVYNSLKYYSDYDTISNWAIKYLAYGVKNDLITDISGYQLSAKRLIDGKTFTSILLKCMGYELKGDMWKISTYINCYLGGISADEAKNLSDKILTKNDMIAIVWETLDVPMANGTPFINSIVSRNNIQQYRLTNLGFKYYNENIIPPVFAKTAVNNNTEASSMQDGSNFIGNSINGSPNGIGVIYYEDGSRYEGNVVNGRREGEGKLIRNDGFVYSGSWENDSMNGYGILKWQNGDSYTGNLKNGVFEGNGTMTWASGDTYSGEWLEGRFSGYGKFNWSNGNYYVGQWLYGEFDGYGTFNLTNVGIYEGQWSSGKRNGRGKYTYLDGTVQIGVWEYDSYIG